MKLARTGYATCVWHDEREVLHVPVGSPPMSDSRHGVTDLDDALPFGVMSRLHTDRRFREIVGLPLVRYEIIHLSQEVVDVML